MLLPARLLPVQLLLLLLPSRRQSRRPGGRQVLLTMMHEAPAMAEELWRTLSGDLRSFLRSRVSQDSDADDILQEVFLKIVEKIGSLRDARRIDSWAYQIARNAIVDHYRRRTPQPADPVEDAAAGGDERDATNLKRSIAAWLALMIDRLPETVREAVRLYDLEAVPQAEIADRLGISLSGAKSRIQRGRRQLEELLNACCKLEMDRRGNVIQCEPVHAAACAQASCNCGDKDP
jgi:RNA polymerase sigma-70 factor (ECF subfamily)